MVDTYRKHNFSYESFATDSAVGNLTEHLRRVVGLEHSSKSIYLLNIQVRYIIMCLHIQKDQQSDQIGQYIICAEISNDDRLVDI